MLILRICERALDSIIDGLAVCALGEKYPVNLSALIDALIDLSDFNYAQTQIKYGEDITLEASSGGFLIFYMLAAASTTLDCKNADQLNKYAKLLIHMCLDSERFKKCFISSVNENENGAEIYRFELGDGAVDVCTSVLKSIK